MSWSWKDVDEEQEKKVYDFQGTVTITTDEYRDLLNEVNRLKFAGQKEHDDWYKEYNLRTALEKEIKALSKRINEIDAWFDEDDVARTKFKLWKVEQIDKTQEEN